MSMAGKRKNGSVLIGLVSGVVIGIFGVMSFTHHDVIETLGRDNLNGMACLIFAAVLIWWAVSPPGVEAQAVTPPPRKWGIFFKGRNWGVGFETITMVVGVLTAVIAILALTHGH